MEGFARSIGDGDAREYADDALHPHDVDQSFVQPASDAYPAATGVDVHGQFGAPCVGGAVLQPVRVCVGAYPAALLPDDPRMLLQDAVEPSAEILLRGDLGLEGYRGSDVLCVDCQHRGHVGGFRHPDGHRRGPMIPRRYIRRSRGFISLIPTSHHQAFCDDSSSFSFKSTARTWTIVLGLLHEHHSTLHS